MNSKILSLIKNKLKKYLKDKDILDVIVFGSVVKEETFPKDIDIAMITEKEFSPNIPKFHISIISPRDFFLKPPPLIHTLLREGYSIINNKYLSETYRFSNKILYSYKLTKLAPSSKVKMVNILRGKGKEKGLVEKNNGQWLANQVFIAPVKSESLFNKIFLNHNVEFNKFYVLIH